MRIAAKAAYVRSQPQTRPHKCHWPGCEVQVPPAQWGCKPHWFVLPFEIRTKIWNAYRPGQEEDGNPSPEYIAAAHEAQEWIAKHLATERAPGYRHRGARLKSPRTTTSGERT